MATWDVKLIEIGNSNGISLPKVLLDRYDWKDSLILEETERGVVLYSEERNKPSWMETYRAMAAADEDWGDFDTMVADGLERCLDFPG